MRQIEETFLIKGGTSLNGTVQVRGSKNAASKMIIASLLTNEPCTLENVPLSDELEITKELCESVGSVFEHPRLHEVRVATKEVTTPIVQILSRKNRIPILALGPLLHRKGLAEVPVLGGCPIGHRPINFHLAALTQMGVKIERRENSYYAEVQKEIKGADIEFPFPSVGATENVILAAVLARGVTTIKGAALEPEILNTVSMLRSMGAKIEVDEGERTIRINGVSSLRGTKAEVMPDRNEVVSFAIAALATGGKVFIPGVEESYLTSFLEKVKDLGGLVNIRDNGIEFVAGGKYQGTYIETSPHPGFMTDWQQPFLILLTQAEGKSIIHETVYEDRFGYTKELVRMGARIELGLECPERNSCRYLSQGYSHVANIFGPTTLRGTKIVVGDLRAGMAHIIAALSAQGESSISGIRHIDRGYEKIDERLKRLGANIERISI